MKCLVGNEYERVGEGGTLMFVRSDQRPLLQQNGLTRFSDFVGCQRGEVVHSHGSRDVRRVELTGENGSKTVYLKRFGPAHLKDAVKDLLCLRRVRTRAVAEFEMLCAFKRAGLAVPDALACGERHVLARDRASFLMVDSLSSHRPLDEVLTRLDDRRRRRRLIVAVARFVRRMHEAGCTHTDLFAKHLFTEEDGDGGWSISVIDLMRARQGTSVSKRRRGRDLAALLVSLRPEAISLRERLAFLLAYLDKTKLDKRDRRFFRRAVLPRARKFSRRSGYRAWRPILEHL